MNIDFLNELLYEQTVEENDNYNDNFDPDINYFNSNVNQLAECRYIASDEINSLINLNDFSICSFNVNSVSKNLDNFLSQSLVGMYTEFDLIGLCETKLNDEIDQLYKIDGFNKITLNNSRNKGGLALFIRENFNNFFERVDLRYKTDHLESLFVEITQSSKNIICGIIYHRPGSDSNLFARDIENILSIIGGENKSIFMFGDYNVNLLKGPANANVRSMVDVFSSFNMFNTITKPTRVTGTSATIIDHVWTNEYPSCTLNAIIYDNVTDHFPIISSFK